ncbi:MAG: HAD family hydrolase [Enterocloster clostridioformis]
MFSGNMGADVVEREASKAEGLKRLCQYYDIGLERTVAFGDSMNDYEIVREAGIGVAMGNSVEELKTVADYVTDDIDRDGIWKACRHFSLI